MDTSICIEVVCCLTYFFSEQSIKLIFSNFDSFTAPGDPEANHLSVSSSQQTPVSRNATPTE